MSSTETPEQHAARMKAALELADAINEATRQQPSQDATVIEGNRYGITGGTHHGNVTFNF
ncbi:hypothetical protein ACFYNL_07540 [Streptomyces sp. NPDC007808]|uniref:hypothetical protein n=1 Tax=Streptomyces sp. NPDC007808 TaxID=3364779 RepID=UPI003690185A